jgi:hypothetical protein
LGKRAFTIWVVECHTPISQMVERIRSGSDLCFRSYDRTQSKKNPLLEGVYKVRVGRFSGSFEPIFDLNLGGNINFRIWPPKFESKIDQNNPKKRPALTL